jgi:hypothetical protein
VISTADATRATARPSWFKVVALLLGLSLMASMTPFPWARLWLVIPVTVAGSLLAGWRFGAWGVLAPVALFAAAMVIEGPFSLWVWWVPVASLTGVWMGLREEGGGPASGERAWMLLPVLLLAALMPWTLHYADLVGNAQRELHAGDAAWIEIGRQIGYKPDRLSALQRAVEDQAKARDRILPYVLPTALFVWVMLLVGAGRSLSAWMTGVLRWPALSRSPLRSWRLPDGAVWLLLLGMTLLVLQWTSWAPTAWTLILNTALAYCVQGIAVVESLLLARGVPPSIIVLTMLFVFAVAFPVFVLTTAAVGLSDVWLDYRRIEPARDTEMP